MLRSIGVEISPKRSRSHQRHRADSAVSVVPVRKYASPCRKHLFSTRPIQRFGMLKPRNLGAIDSQGFWNLLDIPLVQNSLVVCCEMSPAPKAGAHKREVVTPRRPPVHGGSGNANTPAVSMMTIWGHVCMSGLFHCSGVYDAHHGKGQAFRVVTRPDSRTQGRSFRPR
jgi:hypothetical protein